jgi:hypothetical protein
MLTITVKWQSVYGFHVVQMSSRGRCMSEGALPLNDDATHVIPIQNGKLLQFQTYEQSAASSLW